MRERGMQVTPQNPHPTNPKPENKVRVKVWPTTTATTIILQKQRKKEDTIIPLIYHLYLFHSLSFPIQNHGNSTLTLTLSLSIVLSHQWPSWTKIYVEENQKGKKKKKKEKFGFRVSSIVSLSLNVVTWNTLSASPPKIPSSSSLFLKTRIYILFFFSYRVIMREPFGVFCILKVSHTKQEKPHFSSLYRFFFFSLLLGFLVSSSLISGLREASFSAFPL